MNKWKDLKHIKNIKAVNSLKDLANSLTEAARIYTELEVQRIKHLVKTLNSLNRTE